MRKPALRVWQITNNFQGDRFQCFPSPLTSYAFPPQAVPHIDHHTRLPASATVIHPGRRSFGAVELRFKIRLGHTTTSAVKIQDAVSRLNLGRGFQVSCSSSEPSPGRHPENTVTARMDGRGSEQDRALTSWSD